MAATEEDIIRDEQERSNLLRAIADVEAAMAASTPGTRRILENTLENAKKRVGVLDKKIEEAKVEHAAAEQTRIAAAAALAAKETALNARERQEYSGFLEQDFFTKKDFGRLEHFYAHSYDRLTEGGKDEMSKRFWEGVKRGEYQFEDAPSVMQQKEAERAKNRLRLSELSTERLGEMPAEEQRAFATAYNSEDRTKAKQILALNSVGFSNHPDAAKEKPDHLPAENKPSSYIADIDLSAVDLKTVQLADATPVTSTSIPGASGTRTNGR